MCFLLEATVFVNDFCIFSFDVRTYSREFNKLEYILTYFSEHSPSDYHGSPCELTLVYKGVYARRPLYTLYVYHKSCDRAVMPIHRAFE